MALNKPPAEKCANCRTGDTFSVKFLGFAIKFLLGPSTIVGSLSFTGKLCRHPNSDLPDSRSAFCQKYISG